MSTHLDTVEATFSARTRVLDYLWAGLPVVVTEGDTFAGLVKERGAGLVVPPADVDALADALETCLFDEEVVDHCRAAAAELAGDLTWDRVAAPLVEFARSPRRAPDAARATRAANDAADDPWRSRALVVRRALGRVRRRLPRRSVS